jgi:carbamate kinase
MRIVIALGGNALLPKGSEGTAGSQLEAARSAISRLAPLLGANQVVLTHGNGPQVGNLLLQQQATSEVAPMPLDVLDAMTQGQIGYFIASAVSMTGLHSAALITRVVVDADDAAFRNPTKPIGPFFSRPPKNHRAKRGTRYLQDAGRGYRLTVASPKPRKIREHDAIDALLRKGFVVIAVGGGGIPITDKGRGLEAVIDKDRAASLLASQIRADMLIFVTSVDSVYLDFGKPGQKAVRSMGAKDASRYTLAGHFAEGSMKPKVGAALDFLKSGGKKAVICDIRDIHDALEGRAGTTMSP